MNGLRAPGKSAGSVGMKLLADEKGADGMRIIR
jgi:hypothetical protein